MVRLAVTLLLYLFSSAAGAQVLPVKVRTSTGQEGMGFVVGRQSVCVVVTAAHVVANRIDVSVIHATKELGASVLWNGARDTPNSDVAIVSPKEGMPVTCKYLPDATTLEGSLVQPVGQLWVVSATGEVLTPRVTIAKRDAARLSLTVLDEPERFVVGGVSGAAVTFDGKIVAVVSGNADRQLVAERLDAILLRGTSGLAATEARAEEVATPYDLTRIADKYAAPARRGRAIRTEAERVSKLARDVEKLSDEAATFANGIPLGQVAQGHGRFSATNGNYYSGQVKSSSNWLSGGTISSLGFGVSLIQTGEGKGRVYKCSFEDGSGCRGPGVTEWPSGRWKRFEAEFVDGRFQGASRLVGHSGEICFGVITTDEDGSWRFVGDGVSIEADGRRYEGQIGPNCGWDGLGVLWDKTGSIIRVGRWRAGQTVDD